MIRFSWGVFLVLLMGLADAASTATLYQAEVPLAEKNSAEYANAIRRALAVVLVRVTENPIINETTDGKAILNQADRLLRQYKVHGVGGVVAGQAQSLVLQAEFDSHALEQLLQERGLLKGVATQQKVLVWMAVEEPGEQYIVDANHRRELADKTLHAAKARGLSVYFPLMDLEDYSKIKYSDLWGGSMRSVRQASERYGIPAILLGRLVRGDSGFWSAQWTFWLDGLESKWKTQQTGLLEIVAEGVGPIADRMMAVRTGPEAGLLTMTVEGIDSAADYARVEQYLASLASVRRVQVVEIRESQVDLSVELQGDIAGLDRAIAQDQVLEPIFSSASSNGYRLRP